MSDNGLLVLVRVCPSTKNTIGIYRTWGPNLRNIHYNIVEVEVVNRAQIFYQVAYRNLFLDTHVFRNLYCTWHFRFSVYHEYHIVHVVVRFDILGGIIVNVLASDNHDFIILSDIGWTWTVIQRQHHAIERWHLAVHRIVVFAICNLCNNKIEIHLNTNRNVFESIAIGFYCCDIISALV